MAKRRTSIQKGRNFQKKIKEKLQEHFNLEDEDIRVPVGCETGCDIKLSKRAQQIVKLGIECKNQERVGIFAAIKQAKANTEKGCEPAVIFHKSVSGNKEIWICIPLDHYLECRKENLT